MVNLFRALIVIAIASFVAGAIVPFDRPFQVVISLDRSPPLWRLLAGAFLVIAGLAAVASGALLLFRGWGRWPGGFALIGGIIVAWLAVGSPLTESMSSLAALLFALSAFAWLTGLASSFHPAVAVNFRHERP
jgi:hypothetical protein